MSAFYYVTPANKVCIVGELRPKSKFLGNSVSTQMDGENRVYLMGRPSDGRTLFPILPYPPHPLTVCSLTSYSSCTAYVISMPNMYARGILWGKMILELGDMCTARNDRNGYTAEIQFKTKGYFSGTYNAIQGRVRAGTQDMGEVMGKWSELMEYTSKKVRWLVISGAGGCWGLTRSRGRRARSACCSMCRRTATRSRRSGLHPRRSRSQTNLDGPSNRSPPLISAGSRAFIIAYGRI